MMPSTAVSLGASIRLPACALLLLLALLVLRPGAREAQVPIRHAEAQVPISTATLPEPVPVQVRPPTRIDLPAPELPPERPRCCACAMEEAQRRQKSRPVGPSS